MKKKINNKTMKKFLMAMIAAVGVSTLVVSAQDRMYRPQVFIDYAYEGVLLEPAQQTRIDSLNQAEEARILAAGTDTCTMRRGGECQGRRGDCDRAARERKGCCRMACAADSVAAPAACTTPAEGCRMGAHERKCAGDSSACAPREKCRKADGCRHRADARPDRRGPRNNGRVSRQYVAKVREILTPEQFVIFVENIKNVPEGVAFSHNTPVPEAKPSKPVKPARPVKLTRPGRPVKAGAPGKPARPTKSPRK